MAGRFVSPFCACSHAQQMKEAFAKPPLPVDAFVSSASDKDGFLHLDAIETIASTGCVIASKVKAPALCAPEDRRTTR